jgi:hypothetical protein
VCVFVSSAGRFNPLTQVVDIVELGAIYMSLPVDFCNDTNGMKSLWKRGIEEFFKKQYSKYQANDLVEYQKRNAAYKSQVPMYTADTSDYSFNMKIEKRRISQSSLTIADRRAALERAVSKPLLPSKAFL